MAAVTAPSVTGAFAPQALDLHVEFPAKFKPLVEFTGRYLVFFGGRGGAKSWQIARKLLIDGLRGGLRVLCVRQVQSSLKESVKQLLADQIEMLGLRAFYQVLKDEIRGPLGTLFIFKGMNDPEALKSAESIDRIWWEEARTAQKASWMKLDFTIRKPGAQIIVSMNPELETDYLYQLFVANDPPPSSVVVKVGYEDNPWISAAFVEQAERLKASDYDEWLWAIGGHCRVALDGAVYANELRAMRAEGRVCRVPLEKAKPVHAFADLGRGDATALWFAQIVGFEYRVVDCYEANGFVWDHYLAQLEAKRQDRGWFYGTIWLPHDADNRLLGERRTIRQQTEDAGYRVRIVPKVPVAEGINAARTIFGKCWFDEERTLRGRQCLAQYHYDVDDDGTRSKLPEHDWSSHMADAFRYMGVALKDDSPKPRVLAPVKPRPNLGRHGWLAG